jgi:hypothetical protein
MNTDILAKRPFPLPTNCYHCPQKFTPALVSAFKGLAECIAELSRPDSVCQATIEFVSKPAK